MFIARGDFDTSQAAEDKDLEASGSSSSVSSGFSSILVTDVNKNATIERMDVSLSYRQARALGDLRAKSKSESKFIIYLFPETNFHLGNSSFTFLIRLFLFPFSTVPRKSDADQNMKTPDALP